MQVRNPGADKERDAQTEGLRHASPPRPLIGRAPDLARILDRLTEGTSVVIAGPAGIGKSRIAASAVDRLRDDGWGIVALRATPAGRSVPLGALENVVGSAVENPRVALSRLTAIAGGGPTVVLADDVNFLDEASVYVMDGLADCGCRLLLTARDDVLLPPALETRWTAGSLARIDLAGLDDQSVVALAEDYLGGPVGVGLARSLVGVSRGNPLYVRELLTGAVASGRLIRVAAAWEQVGKFGPSPGLAALIRSRLKGLGAREHRLLALVALADPITVADIEVMVPAATDLEGALRRLEAAGLIQIAGGRQRQTVAMLHPLYADVVLADLAEAERRQLCVSLAGRAGTATARDRLRALLWRLEADEPVPPDALLDGARAAHELAGVQLAIRLSRLAVEAGLGSEAEHVLGTVLEATGRIEEAEQVLAAAAVHAAEPQVAALVAMARADIAFQHHDDLAESFARLADVRVGPVAPLATAQEALFHVLSGDGNTGLELARPLLDHPQIAMYAAMAVSLGLCLTGQCREAETVALSAADTRRGLIHAQQLPRETVYLAAACFARGEEGRLGDAIKLAIDGGDQSVRDGDAFSEGWFGLVRGRAELASGHLREAVTWFRQAAVRFDEVGSKPARWAWGGLALAFAQLGHPDEAQLALTRLAESGPTCMRMLDADLERAAAWVAVATGDVEAAVERIEKTAEVAAGKGQLLLAGAAWYDIVRLVPSSDAHLVRAREYLSGLPEKTDSEMAPLWLAHAEAWEAADPARLATTAGRLAHRGMTGGAVDAYAQAAWALASAGRVRDATPLALRARRLAESVGGQATPAVAVLDELLNVTDREYAVGALAAAGTSSRDIATSLFLSGRTVENHLFRLYKKLGVTSRTQLADALAAWCPRGTPS